MADPATLISGLLSNLVPLIKDEFKLIYGFDEEVEKLLDTLSAINAALEHAEIKNAWKKDKPTEDWLQKLKRVAYEVRDIMDECTFEDLRLHVKRRDASSSTRKKVTNFITHPFSNTLSRREIGYKIKDVKEKLEQIYSRRKNLQLREPIHGSKIIDKFTSSWRETMSLSSSSVYGRDKEKKQIIDILLNNSTVSVATELLSVLPIVGIGGLGKTTFAQMVFNDEEVSKHFDTKIWVCVSDEFDIKLVIKSILKEKAEASLSLEELQEKVRDKLRGKRYLIVLDDVWNENKDAWNGLRSILDCGINGSFILTTTRKRRVAEIMKTIPHFELPSLSDDNCWLLFKERAFEHVKPKHPNIINIGKQIARRCKGVPLVAKTLGSQLGFCDDEKDWHRIRDSEIWEISENEEDLLPILRLSYYDLPYHLRRCFVFCAIFPKDTEIEIERLIQLWMAHGLIPPVKKQEVEDVGNTIWKELCWRSFFQDEKKNKIGYTTCKMHDLMHNLAQSVMQEECYTMNAKRSSDGLGREIRHVTAMVDKLNQPSVCSLKKIRGLQSIMLNDTDCDGNVTKEILSGLKELLTLRVLEVRHCVQYQDLSYASRLKHLRFLDISYSEITTLPNSICDLFNLQTLKLNYCSKLESLPRNMRNLISLRHLYLDCCFGLRYIPRWMGELKHLKTLSLFVISEIKDHCQLDELKELNIRGSLKIKNIGRIGDASIARGISMAKMSSITNLELDWGYTYDVDHEKIGKALEVSTERLKKLRMNGYEGVNPPRWVGKSSPSVTRLERMRMDNVDTIGSSSSADSEIMIVIFPLLELLDISNMKSLRELVSPTVPSRGAFPNLCEIMIYNCPKLGALPPHLKSLKRVSVEGECSDELLYSISNLSALTHLDLVGLNERSVLFGAGYMALIFDDEIPSLSSQILGDNDNNNEEQLGGVCSTFQSLSIRGCLNLRCLFDEGMMMEEEPLIKISSFRKQQNYHHLFKERTRLITSLTELHILNCPELMISVDEFRNLNYGNNSLQILQIRGCPKFVSSEDIMGLLRSIQTRLGPANFDVDIQLEEVQGDDFMSVLRSLRARLDPI
ncbi:putative disease resistance protein RGA3 [Impatiens glandulifera]|uniref:putative disease resistance protein RGA3 n=1 Tax=Impatiens glandulifera TaxID=253017 RepID=UPI001FB0A87E|nr:putative disease resistance protein RGA3 [Impatiens glandulifera]